MIAGADIFGDGETTPIDRHAPLRLAEAARIAFPLGGMTASGLRKEHRRGKLTIETIAGKQYTTLACIEEMREKCRVVAKAPALEAARPAEGTQNRRFSRLGHQGRRTAYRHGMSCESG